MIPIRTFRHGGIQVPTGKDWLIPAHVPNAFLPNAAVVMLKQHAGAAAHCVVHRGEFVREGMVVGRADTAFSANVHAPVPGVVRDIRKVALPEGGESEAVIIALDGAFDRLGKKGERYLWRSMTRNDILQCLRECGVIEAEPPGLPLFDLFCGRTRTDLLILNGVESEPYLRSENSLLLDKTLEIIDGLEILHKILSPARTVIAVDAVEIESEFRQKLPPENAPDLLLLESRYPQDMPRQLLEALGQRDSGIEIAIVKPSTAFAIHEAVVLAKPMLERYVTIAGGAVKYPSVLKARIGTPIGDLIEECGGFLGPPARLVLGGPFRGHAIHDLDSPITKTCSAVLALTNQEVGRGLRSPCIRCGRCALACPERLDPDRLYRLIENQRIAQAREHGLDQCTLCGACGYVCPSRIQLVAAFSARKRILDRLIGEHR
jgi:electron transport complex protein RnfC